MNVFEKLYFFNYLDELYGSDNDEITRFKQAIYATPKANAIISQYNATITKNQGAIEKEYENFVKKHPKHSKEQEEKFFRDMFEKQFVQANDAFLEVNADNYWVKHGNLILNEKDKKTFDSFNKVLGGVRWSDRFTNSEMFKKGGGVNRWFSNDNLSESYNIRQADGTIQTYHYTYPKDFIFGSFASDERSKIINFFNLTAPLQGLDDLLESFNFTKDTTQKQALKKIFEEYTNDQNRNFIEAFDAISKEYGIEFPKNDSANTKLDSYANRGVLIGLESVMNDKKINQSDFSNQSITSSPYYYPERKKFLDSLGTEGYSNLVKSIKDSLAQVVKESPNKEDPKTRSKMAMLLALEKDPRILYRLDPRFFDASEKHSSQIGMFFNRNVFKDLHVQNSHYIAFEKQLQKDKEELEDNGNANAANNKLAKQHFQQVLEVKNHNKVLKLELNATVDNADSLNQEGLKVRGYENAAFSFTKEVIKNDRKNNEVLEPDYKTPFSKTYFAEAVVSNPNFSNELLKGMRQEFKDDTPTPSTIKQHNIKYSIFNNNLDGYARQDPQTIRSVFEKNGVKTVEDLFKQFQADPFYPKDLKGIDLNKIMINMKQRNGVLVYASTPIDVNLAKQMQSILLVTQYQRLIYNQAKKELEKNPNKDLDAVATDIYQKSSLFPYSNKNLDYQRNAHAFFDHFKHTDKGKVQNLGGISEIVMEFGVDPNAKNQHMPTLHIAKTGYLKNLFGDLAAYETNKGDGLILTVTPHHKRLATHKAPQYEKKVYLVGSSVHDLSKGLESSVVELDQRKYGSPESLHTIGGSPKSEAMLALAHLSKSLSIDNQDPNAPLSDTLKKRLDDLVLGKATFRTYACVNDQYVEFDRTSGIKFDINDKMLTETLMRYSAPIAQYILKRKKQWHIKVSGDVDSEKKEEVVAVSSEGKNIKF